MPEDKVELVFPSVHINGTSIGELKRQYLAAYEAVGVALQRVGDAGPNARDYYPQGQATTHAAMAQHASRVGRIKSVHEELEAILLALGA